MSSRDDDKDPGRDEYDLNESDQDVTGDIGVSSGRVGYSGGGHVAPTGTRDTSVSPPAADEDTPPEQSQGGEEFNPDGLDPKAPFPSLDPRSSGDEPEPPPDTDARPDEPR